MMYLSRFTVFHFLTSFVLIALISHVSHAESTNRDEATFTEAAKYTVKILTRINYPFIEDSKLSSIGTGFLINREKGLILTNAHVVGRSRSQIKAMFKDEEYQKVKKLYVDPVLDLAIIQYPKNKIPKKAIEAKLDCDSTSNSGVPVGAYGHPWSLSFTATRGIISGTPYIGYADWIQTDAPINSGNSGGPLIGLKSGKVVGISSATLSKKETEGLNFALPIRYACKVVDLFNAEKTPLPLDLGVIFFETKESKPLKVAEVVNKNISGLQVGDIIKSVDGDVSVIKNPFHLMHLLRGRNGDITLNIIRDGKQKDVTLKTEYMSDMLKRKGIYFSGMIIAPNNFKDRNLTSFGHAWMVHFIDEGSMAQTEKVEEWDLLIKIDNKPLGGFDDVMTYLKNKHAKSEEVKLIFRRLSDGSRKMNDYHEVSLLVEDEEIIKVQ